MRKNWDAILRDISSPESSDAEDGLNVLSVTKNARRVAEVVTGVIPTLPGEFKGLPPKGMNSVSVLRDGLEKSFAESQERLRRPSCDGPTPPSPLPPAPSSGEGDARQAS